VLVVPQRRVELDGHRLHSFAVATITLDERTVRPTLLSHRLTEARFASTMTG
jgi:hypothetical protein